MRRLNVPTKGGLGNQLFITLGSWSIAQSLGRELRVNLWPTDEGCPNIGDSIRSFRLRALAGATYISRPQGMFEKFGTGVASRKTRFSGDIPVIGSFSLLNTDFVNLRNHANFDFTPKSKHLVLESYLQDHELINAIPEHVITSFFQLDKPSSSFNRLRRDFEKSPPPVVLHLRRGDYVQSKDRYGLLGLGYYRKALDELEVSLDKDKVLVFSDDLHAAEQLIKSLGLKNGETFHSDTSAAEDLLLMSMASKLVIANSTFSWWSGFLKEDQSTVVAPKPWFPRPPIPKKIIPKKWKISPSGFD